MRVAPSAALTAALAAVCPAQGPAVVLDADLATRDVFDGVRGTWARTADGLTLSTTDAYDNAAFAAVWLDGRYTIEVELTHTNGLVGGGVLFACRDRDVAPPAFGQMIRFDTPGELLFGHFAAGQFHADGRATLPAPVPLGARAVLRVDVDTDAARASVAVDGVALPATMPLEFVAGHVALEGSLGAVRFHRARVTAAPPARPALRWPESFVAADGGFVVHDRRGGAWWLPVDGGPAVPRSGGAVQRVAHAPGARIDGDAVVLPDGGRFRGRELGGIVPVALDTDPGGRLLVLDQRGGRVVAVPDGGDPPADRLEHRAGSVRLASGAPAVVAAGDGRLLATSDTAGWCGPLPPSTRLVLRTPIATTTWPASPGWRDVPFVSEPGDGRMRVHRLRVVVGIFGNVGVTDDEARALPALDDAGYARIEAELRACALWYFQHSGRRLWLDLSFVRRPTPVAAGALSESGEANGTPPEPLLAALARDAGVPLAGVDGFVVAMDHRVRRTPDGPVERVGRGGGLTLGAHGRGHGLSWWFVPGTPGYDGWLLCHEFGHQLDALFEIAGHPEFPFNHFAPSLGNVAFFGEHWDGNRWIVAGWPDHLWDALTTGEVVLVADRDGDRVPDDAPALPFDERRSGSSPDRADTDGDGLDDGDEAARSSWLVESGFERQLGARCALDPSGPDSDGDGIRDGDDPWPWLAATPRLRDGTWVELGARGDDTLRVSTSVRRAGGTLEIRAVSNRVAQLAMQVLLDDGADGWFEGRLNARIQVRGDGARVVEVLDAHSAVDWPTARPELAAEFTVAARRDGDALVLTITPRSGLAPGAALGLAIGYRTPDADDPQWRTVFPPHALVRFEVDG